MVAAALVSHRSLPPVSLLLFLFSFPFSVWLFGLRRVVCFFSHSHFFSSFLNSLTLSARRHEAELEFTTIAASLPAHCCHSLASFSGHFSFCHFFSFSPLCQASVWKDYRCLFRFSLVQQGKAGSLTRDDILVFRTGGCTLMHTDCPRRQSTCHVNTHFFPVTKDCNSGQSE